MLPVDPKQHVLDSDLGPLSRSWAFPSSSGNTLTDHQHVHPAGAHGLPNTHHAVPYAVPSPNPSKQLDVKFVESF